MDSFEDKLEKYSDYEGLAETSVTFLEADSLWSGLQKSKKKKKNFVVEEKKVEKNADRSWLATEGANKKAGNSEV